MREFKTFIVDRGPQPEPSIKIAIIDTGVDCNKLQHPIASGISFYGGSRDPDINDEFSNPEFLDFDANPSVHGTHMAMCVQEVLPVAKLHIARKDDSNKSAQEFTLSSAIEVSSGETSKSPPYNLTQQLISMHRLFNGQLKWKLTLSL